MFRPSLRVLVPATTVVIAYGALFLRADPPPSEKVEVRGLAAETVTIQLKSDGVLVVKQALVKSLGGRSFLVGTMTSGPRQRQRAWVAVDEISRIYESEGPGAAPEEEIKKN